MSDIYSNESMIKRLQDIYLNNRHNWVKQTRYVDCSVYNVFSLNRDRLPGILITAVYIPIAATSTTINFENPATGAFVNIYWFESSVKEDNLEDILSQATQLPSNSIDITKYKRIVLHEPFIYIRFGSEIELCHSDKEEKSYYVEYYNIEYDLKTCFPNRTVFLGDGFDLDIYATHKRFEVFDLTNNLDTKEWHYYTQYNIDRKLIKPQEPLYEHIDG